MSLHPGCHLYLIFPFLVLVSCHWGWPASLLWDHVFCKQEWENVPSPAAPLTSDVSTLYTNGGSGKVLEPETDAMYVFLLLSFINLSHFRTEDQPAKAAIFSFHCFDYQMTSLLQALTDCWHFIWVSLLLSLTRNFPNDFMSQTCFERQGIEVTGQFIWDLSQNQQKCLYYNASFSFCFKKCSRGCAFIIIFHVLRPCFSLCKFKNWVFLQCPY